MQSHKKQKWFRELLRRRLFFCLLILLQILAFLYFIISRSLTSNILSRALYLTSVIVALHIISRRDKEAYKLTWVFFILIFPVFGGLMYLFFRCQTRSKRLLKTMKDAEKQAKSACVPDLSAYTKALETTGEHARQIEYLEKYAGYPIYENTLTEYLSPGEKFLEKLLTDLEKAEKYIFIESFIIQDGEMWESILEILKRKSANGVDVRIIYDDMGCFLRLPKHFVKDMEKLRIRCVTFNQFIPVFTAIQNYRDHRKIIAIDGKIAYTGGLNIADEYINKIQPFGHWKDSGLRLEGEAAWSLTLIFLEMWILSGNKETALETYYPYHDTPCPITKKDSFVQPFADAPFDDENISEHVYMQIINKAKDYVYIMTPYLIIDNSMVSALCTAAKSGVDIRIITPFRWDKRTVHFMTRSYYRELIKAGIRIYEYNPGFIHSKTFVSDDEVATVGSANMDFRSLYLQFECGAWLYGAEAVTELRDDFLATLPLCKEIRAEDCKDNAFIRFLQDVLRLIAPLM
ncbi:MAG: cardiolipin synthase [Clostridia bacterium]|nr:cardiolipin synthase [Clostridia bacterium]